ncbi:type II toxin-antitoxin system HicB family antitoxin [Leuconostocaceae bacterium ESL0958]|nr:type II toxin-antitoxin system HicB family antitoxin [Leuconostocaceae bacterium ESL0958]
MTDTVIYPIIITPTESKDCRYFVEIPDVDGFTEANTIEESLEMARGYIGEMAIDYQDIGETLPPSNKTLPIVTDPNALVTLIDVNIDDYIRKHDNRLVKKTLTIPNYLNELAKERHVNFSRVLVDALQKQLN